MMERPRERRTRRTYAHAVLEGKGLARLPVARPGRPDVSRLLREAERDRALCEPEGGNSRRHVSEVPSEDLGERAVPDKSIGGDSDWRKGGHVPLSWGDPSSRVRLPGRVRRQDGHLMNSRVGDQLPTLLRPEIEAESATHQVRFGSGRGLGRVRKADQVVARATVPPWPSPLLTWWASGRPPFRLNGRRVRQAGDFDGILRGGQRRVAPRWLCQRAASICFR
jgi:hypothetical protein